MELALCVLGVLAVVLVVYSVPAPEPKDYYTAAVFEHARLGNLSSDSPDEVKQKNLDMYIRAAEVAANKGADIIIFPEYGIFPPNSREGLKNYLECTPDPRNETSNPCDQKEEFSNRPILYTLSCMAKRYNIVVVANTGDIQPCSSGDSKCPKDGVYHFNTNVAFAKNGTLISRYHKEHLFYELGMDLPREKQDPVFTTDFGRFGMFVCFDIVFKETVDTAKRVDNVILSTMWIDPMPLMNSVQLWQGWALGNNVTYLVANVQIPGYGAVGSGVFSGHAGAIKYTYNPDGLSKLIVSRAPISKHQSGEFPNPDSSITVIIGNQTSDYDEENDGKDVPEQCSSEVLGEFENPQVEYRCLHENTENYTFVKLTQTTDVLEACNNGMCCSLNYTASSMNESFYLGVYNGTYNMFNRYFWCEENCLVVRCDPRNGNPCGIFPMRSNTVFEKLELKSNFTTNYVYPSVLWSAMRLAPLSEWSPYVEDAEDLSINAGLSYASDSQKFLLVAGLNARCYQRDPPYKR